MGLFMGAQVVRTCPQQAAIRNERFADTTRQAIAGVALAVLFHTFPSQLK